MVLRGIVMVAAVAVAAIVIAGKREEIAGATSYFEDLNYFWVLVGAGFELAAVMAFAVMQQRLLAAGDVSAGLAPVTGITFAGNALQNSLPGGGAWASVYAFRQFRRLGADDVLAAWLIIAISGLSAVGLAILAGVGLAMAEGDAASADLVVGILVVLVIAAILVVLARNGLLRRPIAIGLALSKRLFGRPSGDVETFMADTESRLLAVTPSRPEWGVALLLAVANWGLDCVCLGTSFLAVGAPVPWRGLLLAYGAAQLAANLPLTPGGLGVVEGSLAIALVQFGGGQESTVAAVLMYRLMSFWALVVIGWITMGTMAWLHRRRRSR